MKDYKQGTSGATRNPKNEISPLFRGLTRLFSGPYVNYRRQQVRKGRKSQLQTSKFLSLGGLEFKKEYGLEPFKNLMAGQLQASSRAERYLDFDQMEFMAEIASSMDIYADEITTATDFQEILKIKCPNEEIKSILHTLFYEVLNVEFNLFGWTRTMCKYGDLYLYLDIDEKLGITNVIGLPSVEIERLEGEDKTNANYVQYQWNAGAVTFENWQVAHFRILGNDKFAPYGTSILEPARRIWRQLCYSYDTKVWVKSGGYKEIQYVEPGETVLAYDYKNSQLVETKVKNVASMGRQEVVEIQTAHRTIKVTPNHGMYVKTKSGEIICKQAKDLIVSNGKGGWDCRKADKLILPSGWQEQKDGHCIKISQDIYEGQWPVRNVSWRGEDFYTTPEFLRVLGFMIGDGWINKNKLGFALGIEEEQNECYVNLMKETMRLGDLERVDAEHKRGGQVNFNSKEVVSIFKEAGFISGFDKKRVPSWVYSMNQENKVEFLRGLMDADGCWTDGRLALSNKELMEDVRILAQQAGVAVGREIKLDRKAGIYEDKCFGEITRKDSYRLYLNLDSIVEEDVTYETVCRVIDIGEEETYDLEVEHESHNFVSEGIVASNTLIEDAMMAYRVVRSPERRVFYIDVGNIDPNDVEAYIEKMKTNLRRHQIVDQSTGRVDLRYNPLSIEEDYFVPLRGDKSSRIETLPGGTYTGDIDDVNYLRDKLFSALKVPKSYLAQGDQMEDKTTLAQKDMHFARTVQRLQRAVISELYKVAVVHLYTLGYRDKDLATFTLHLNNPSKIAELQELEYLNTKFGLINNTPEGYFSKRWISKNILNHSDDEIIKNKIEMFHDAKFMAKLESVAAEEAAMQQQAMMGAMGGMPGMEGMGGMPGMEGMEGMGAPPGGEMPPGEETMLLAEPGAEEGVAPPGAEAVPGMPPPPAKRDGPKKNDGRSHGGPFKRNMDSLVGIMDPRETGVIPPDMISFSRGIVFGDSVEPDPDEALLLEASSRVEELFKDVELSKIDKEKIDEQISYHKKRSSKK